MADNIALIAKALKEFIFLKFDLQGDELVKEVESDKWKSPTGNRQPTRSYQHFHYCRFRQKDIEDAPQKKGNESNTEVLQPHNNPPPRISTSSPISFRSDSPILEIMTVQWALSKSDWFSNLKAVAIFPHECDPVI